MTTDVYLKDYHRRLKSISQKFLLIGIETTDFNIIYCKLVGTSNRIYTIKIELYRSSNLVIPNCNCPDCTIRKVTCKHMYWFGRKKLGVAEPYLWTLQMIDLFVYNNLWYYNQ